VQLTRGCSAAPGVGLPWKGCLVLPQRADVSLLLTSTHAHCGGRADLFFMEIPKKRHLRIVEEIYYHVQNEEMVNLK
jgi:hypothetical protein